MTEEALRTIHRRMIEAVAAGEAGSTPFTTVPTGTKTARTGSRIPVWPCKPAGLSGHRFFEAILVGDSGSDMEFGRRIGARTVLIHPDDPPRRSDPCTIFRCGTAKNTVLELKNAKPLGSLQPNLCGRITEKQQIFRTSKNIIDPDLMRTFVP